MIGFYLIFKKIQGGARTVSFCIDAAFCQTAKLKNFAKSAKLLNAAHFFLFRTLHKADFSGKIEVKFCFIHRTIAFGGRPLTYFHLGTCHDHDP